MVPFDAGMERYSGLTIIRVSMFVVVVTSAGEWVVVEETEESAVFPSWLPV